MLNSEILDVAIGVIFVFILVSIICSAVREGIEAWLKTRSAYLEHGIRELLHDLSASGLAKHLYEHPLIYPLFSGGYTPTGRTKRPGTFARGGNLPSYIPSRNFALALMDIAARGPATDRSNTGPNADPVTAANIRANIHNLQNPAVQRLLLNALDEAQGDMERARRNVELWFDSSMDRVSGWYKRKTYGILLGIGFFVAAAANIDGFRVAHYLYRTPTVREALAARATRLAQDGTALGTMNYERARVALDSLGLPIGWSNARFEKPVFLANGGTAARKPPLRAAAPIQAQPDSLVVQAPQPRPDSPRARTAAPVQAAVERAAPSEGAARINAAQRDTLRRPAISRPPPSLWLYVLASLPGWIVTAFAASLGAPFWFDVLNKVMVIRSTVKPYEKSPAESSEDRQIKPSVIAGTQWTAGAAPAVAAQTPGSAPPAGVTLAPQDVSAVIPLTDPEEHLEGCGVLSADQTYDDELPAAQGGVAQ